MVSLDRSQAEDGTHLVVVDGDLDTASSPELGRCLADIVEGGGRHVVLDLAGVGFIDSSGLLALVTANTKLRRVAGDLRIARPSEAVRLLLGLSRMDTVFGVFETREAALGSLS